MRKHQKGGRIYFPKIERDKINLSPFILAEHVGIDLRSAHVGVSEQRLHGADITATPQQFGSKGMAERMACSRLRQPATAHSQLDCPLNGADMHMVAQEIYGL